MSKNLNSKIFLFLYALGWSLVIPLLALLSITIIQKWRNGLLEKLGFLGKSFKPNPIWFHAVSVGELNALIPLLKYFRGMNICLSTSTLTAQNMAKSKLRTLVKEDGLTIFYMPWDHPLIIKNTIAKIKPSALILMETEIWPALISESKNQNIPSVLINARLADKSYRNYKIFKFIFQGIIDSFSLILAQSPNDSRKFIELGLAKNKIYMTGNMKFTSFQTIKAESAAKLKTSLGYSEKDRIIIAASTHEYEESEIIHSFTELKGDFPELRLILAPRHPERFETVREIIQSAAHLETRFFSEFKESKEKLALESSNDVLLVNTIGDLSKLFGISDIAFVGGTINENIGGHNVLEPASYGVPTVIGPHFHKNTETVKALEGAGGLFVCEDLQDIKITTRNLLENPDEHLLASRSAKKLIDENKHIIKDTADKILELLRSRKSVQSWDKKVVQSQT